MKRKRLDRDTWWQHNKMMYPPYYQMRVDVEGFCGIVCLIKLIDGDFHYWDWPISGKVAVIGNGMTWLQLIPDGKKRVITAKYLPDDTISIWYVDIIENIEYDTDGVAIFVDKFLDVAFSPQGEVIVDDRDELDAALQSGDISKEQHEAALYECDQIVSELCSDIENIKETEILCNRILVHINNRINAGEKQFATKYNSGDVDSEK
jgi:hypothetical protein